MGMVAKWLWVAVFGLLAVGCSTEPLDLAEFPPDQVLDCTDDSSWGIQGDVDPDAVGFATAAEALSDTFSRYIQVSGELREAESSRPSIGSLLNNDNREVVTAIASEVSPDNWHVTTISGCNGYELF